MLIFTASIVTEKINIARTFSPARELFFSAVGLVLLRFAELPLQLCAGNQILAAHRHAAGDLLDGAGGLLVWVTLWHGLKYRHQHGKKKAVIKIEDKEDRVAIYVRMPPKRKLNRSECERILEKIKRAIEDQLCEVDRSSLVREIEE